MPQPPDDPDPLPVPEPLPVPVLVPVPLLSGSVDLPHEKVMLVISKRCKNSVRIIRGLNINEYREPHFILLSYYLIPHYRNADIDFYHASFS